MKLKNLRAIVTGASHGFGLAVSKAYVQEGANIVICARNKSDLAIAHGDLLRIMQAQQKVQCIDVDISRESDVNRLINYAVKEMGGVDILVCNAGVYGPKGPIETIDWHEWTEAIAINLLGTVLCCRAVLPILKMQKSGKIIIISGGGATKPMPNLSAYAASKAAVVRFAETLAMEVADYGIDVNTIAPGALNTRLLDEVIEAGPEKVGEKFYSQALRQKDKGGDPLERGASLAVYLASPMSKGVSGKLISAIWDQWERLAEHAEELQGSDIYTLRRIVPQDRNKNWTSE